MPGKVTPASPLGSRLAVSLSLTEPSSWGRSFTWVFAGHPGHKQGSAGGGLLLTFPVSPQGAKGPFGAKHRCPSLETYSLRSGVTPKPSVDGISDSLEACSSLVSVLCSIHIVSGNPELVYSMQLEGGMLET